MKEINFEHLENLHLYINKYEPYIEKNPEFLSQIELLQISNKLPFS